MADVETKTDNEGGEKFRIGALLTGPLNWRNHLKVGVFCLIILGWFIIGSWCVQQYQKFFGNSKPAHSQESTIAGNTGTVTQTDSHESSQVVHNHMPLENGLLGLFMGSKDKVLVEKDKAAP